MGIGMDTVTGPVTPQQHALRLRIAVIGAGAVGLSTALYLQRSGHDVTIIDRSLPEQAASYEKASSFGNACTFATGACIPVSSPSTLASVPKMLLDRTSPLSIYWRDLLGLFPWLYAFIRAGSTQEVSRLTGVLGALIRHAEPAHHSLMREAGALHLARREGCLYLYRTPTSFAAAQAEIALREREGVAMRILTATDIAAREPHLAPMYHKGLLFEDAYHIDTPYQYLLALAALFRQKGGRIVQSDVPALISTDQGVRIGSGVSPGAPDAFDRVVVAAGAWSAKLAASVGDRVLLNTERGYHVLFEGGGHLLSAPTCYPEFGFYMTPLSEGLRAAGTVELGGLDRPLRPVRTDRIEKTARSLLPGVGQVERRWLGFRPSMPDSLPVIGRSMSDARVVYAFGHGHIGLTLAGLTGQLVGEIINERPMSLDISALRHDRF